MTFDDFSYAQQMCVQMFTLMFYNTNNSLIERTLKTMESVGFLWEIFEQSLPYHNMINKFHQAIALEGIHPMVADGVIDFLNRDLRLMMEHLKNPQNDIQVAL